MGAIRSFAGELDKERRVASQRSAPGNGVSTGVDAMTARILHLQRTAGNQAVNGLLRQYATQGTSPTSHLSQGGSAPHRSSFSLVVQRACDPATASCEDETDASPANADPAQAQSAPTPPDTAPADAAPIGPTVESAGGNSDAAETPGPTASISDPQPVSSYSTQDDEPADGATPTAQGPADADINYNPSEPEPQDAGSPDPAPNPTPDQDQPDTSDDHDADANDDAHDSHDDAHDPDQNVDGSGGTGGAGGAGGAGSTDGAEGAEGSDPGTAPDKWHGSRGLSSGEQAYARDVYADSLDYGAIMVTSGDLASVGASRTLGNTINLQDDYFDGSTSNLTPGGRNILIHEMGHVWQFQHGGLAYIPGSLAAQVAKGRSGPGDAYDWREAVTQNLPWDQWNPEQQAEAMEDYNRAIRRMDAGKPLPQDADTIATLQPYVEKVRGGLGAPGGPSGAPSSGGTGGAPAN